MVHKRDKSLIAAAMTSLLFGLHAAADPIHAIRDGAYWHHDSGWVFPEEIAGFARVGAAQDVAGSRDAVAYYAREENGRRTMTASVVVYPEDSATGPTSFENAKSAIELEAPEAKLKAEGRFKLSGPGDLSAASASYLVVRGETSSRTDLYFVDSGEWLVTVRIRTPLTESTAPQPPDEFVRAQRWDTLLNPTCSGAPCEAAPSSAVTSARTPR